MVPTGMRLHEWIALERGYFQAEGIAPNVRWDVVRGIMSRWDGKAYGERPQDEPFRGQSEPIDVINHSVWGSVCNAGAGLGKFVPDAFSIARWAIFVRPYSTILCPRDLANVPIAVGLRAGSHFNVPYRLEPFLPLDQIKTLNVGGFGARLQAFLDGEVDAASLLDPQISMAEQLGLRCIIANTFKTVWVAAEGTDRALVDAYFRVLQRADADLDRDPASCLPLWHRSIPREFAACDWDYSNFDVGERFVHQPLARAEFEQVIDEAERWGLADQMRSRAFDDLAYQPL